MNSASTRLAVADITASLVTDFDLPLLLQKIVLHALRGFDALSSAIVLIRDREAHVAAESVRPGADIDPAVHVIGPGLASALDGAVAIVSDIGVQLRDGRWGRYRDLALAGGAKSVRSFPIVSLGAPLGSLVVHTDDLWGSQRSNDFGQTLADLVALALACGSASGRRSSAADSVESILLGTATIAMATGILAEHFGDRVPDARLRLSRLARMHGITATEYAKRILLVQKNTPHDLAGSGVLDPPPDLAPPPYIGS